MVNIIVKCSPAMVGVSGWPIRVKMDLKAAQTARNRRVEMGSPGVADVHVESQHQLRDPLQPAPAVLQPFGGEGWRRSWLLVGRDVMCVIGHGALSSSAHRLTLSDTAYEWNLQ